MKLTSEQLGAVQHKGNVLLTACPGSGKTRTLVAKAVAEMDGIRGSPRRVCCITYTNTAAQEIEERAGLELQPGDEHQLTVSTIHSFCLNEVLRPYWWLLPDFVGSTRVITADNPDFEEIATHAAAQVNYFNLRPSDFEAFSSLAVNANGEIVGLAAGNVPVAKAAPYFWSRCAELGYIDFCTIIFASYRILRDHPRVAMTLCAKYAWILVDEFQDTTELQIEILKLLHATFRSNFFLVGDLNQSIYAFTGARPELVEPFAKEIGARTNLSLSENFRSSGKIVAHAERLFPRVPAMTAVGTFRDDPTEPVLVRDVSPFVAITEFFLPMLTDLKIGLGNATILGKGWPSLISLSRQLRDYGVPVVGPGARPYRRSRLFAPLAEQLCGAVMETRPETMHQLERALFHAIQDITGHATSEVFGYSGRVVIIRLLRAAKRLAERGGAVDWLDHMAEAAGDILLEFGVIDRTQAGMFYASVQEMKADMVRQGVDLANLTIDDLGLFANPSTALRLSTIHHAKGREFAAVAIIGLREGTLPDFRATSADAINGERRLFYVGVTRAQRLLQYVAERNSYGNPPSRFLGIGGVNILI